MFPFPDAPCYNPLRGRQKCSVAPASRRENLADLFITRLTVLGAAALGFLVTFLLLDHEIHGLKNVMLPLLSIVPAYLFLASLNTWWAARAAAKSGLPAWPADPKADRTSGVGRFYTTGLGLAFGVIAALCTSTRSRDEKARRRIEPRRVRVLLAGHDDIVVAGLTLQAVRDYRRHEELAVQR